MVQPIKAGFQRFKRFEKQVEPLLKATTRKIPSG